MLALTLSGPSVLVALACLSASYLLIILILKYNRFSGIKLVALKETGIAMRLGLCFALCSVLLAFSWTDFDYQKNVSDGCCTSFLDDVVEIDIPRTKEKKMSIPPPPKRTAVIISEPPITSSEIIEAPDVIEENIVDDNLSEEEPVYMAVPKALPLPPAPKENSKPLIIAEEMPRFPGCEEVEDREEQRRCYQKKLLDFVYDNVRYPSIAKENDIKGQVVVRFVVDEDGFISKSEVLRDIGGGCGKEILRVVNLMNDMPERWIPGKQRGKPVKVWFNLPVQFRLE